MKPSPSCLLVFVALPCWAADFANLNFEAATVGPQPGPQYLSPASAIPGWSAYLGGSHAPEVLYKDLTIGGAAIVLQHPQAPDGGVSGNFGLMLISGENPSGLPSSVSASISQTGDVPSNVQTLLFDTGLLANNLGDRVKVSLGGYDLPLQSVLPGTWGATIAPWSGQTLELRFEALYRDDLSIHQTFFSFDNIRFSPVALVPEPSTWALLGVGGAALLLLGRRRTG